MVDAPRVGDAERERANTQLLDAVGTGMIDLTEYEERSGRVWRSRTRPELDAVVADLNPRAKVPAPSGLPRPGTAVARRAATALGAIVLPLALLGGLVAAGQDGVSVFGSRDVVVSEQDPSAKVSVLFGSVQILVPDDARVEVSGLTVFGSVDCDAACLPGNTGTYVGVRSIGGFGSVSIKTESEAADD